MTVLVFVVLAAFADYRAVRLLKADSLIDGWRSAFESWAFVDPDADVREPRPVFDRHRRYRHGLTVARGKLGELGTCPWCLGWHGAWIITVFAKLTGIVRLSWAAFWLVLWAVAGAQGLLSALEGVLDHEQEE